MSNATLKEQLQALSLGSTPTSDEIKTSPTKQAAIAKSAQRLAPHAPRKPIPPRAPVKPKPAWLEQAQYGVELLKAHFPACFKEMKEVQPLKVGIKQDLIKLLSSREDIVTSDKACMVSSIAYYVNAPAYHKSIAEGAVRIDLEGNTSGAVTAEEAKYSTDARKAKQLKKQQKAVTKE